MKNILYLCNISLKNPIRGTPLRIYNFLNQIKKENNLFVCVKDVNEDFDISFIPYPNYRGFKKILYFINLIRQNKIDLILTSTEIGVKLPILFKFFKKVEIAIDLHGLRAEELYLNKSISRFKKFSTDKMIKFYLCFYDLIFVVSNKLKEYYKNINSNIEAIYGGVNLDEFSKKPNLDDSNLFTIGYTGNSRSYQGLDYLLNAAKNIKNKKLFKFRLNLILSGEKKGIADKLKQDNLYNETILNFNVEHKKINDLISQSHVLVIPRPNLKVTKYVYPSKLSEYLATGIPTIITEVGPVEELLNNDICIIIGTKNISQNLERALLKVYDMTGEERKIIGINAINFVKDNLTWDILGKKINKCLSELK